MNSRRFLEWIEHPDDGVGGWTLLDAKKTACRCMDEPPGWYMRSFRVWSGREVLNCYFDRWWERLPHVAVYETESIHPEFGVGLPCGQAYVREVAPPLLLSCTWSTTDSACLEAVFTTAVTGSEVLRVPSSCANLEAAAHLVAKAAITQERLQSPNQVVCILVEGQPDPLTISTVSDELWNQWKSEDALLR